MPNILFVCTANIIRSPVACALFENRLRAHGLGEGWTVSSAGTWAASGYPAAPQSQELMAKKSLDLSSHRARMVDRALVAEADLILVMELGHKEALLVEFPEARGRVFLLSEMVGKTRDVRDPIGGTIEDFQEMIDEIQAILEGGFEKILTLARDNHARSGRGK